MKSKRSSPVIGVVDDDESVRLAISSSLRSANWKVTAYSSADELLGDRRQSELKLVVADIHMPGTDGFGLLEAIRQWPGCESVAGVRLIRNNSAAGFSVKITLYGHADKKVADRATIYVEREQQRKFRLTE